ncbi:MAG: DNA polymerase III subunit chi [Gammaproteobacteria bacterium]|nr:DNA polymerase III subunit chi [Gammaproteobacteria bacterium]
MTLERIDFYLLNQSLPDGKLRAACRLSRRALSRGYTAYIHIRDSGQASRLDDLLWTFDQGSFVPHRLGDKGGDPAPVTIGGDPPEHDHPEVLIELTDEMPDYFHNYKRIVEIVDTTEADRRLARQRYRLYRDNGYQPNTHRIDP